MALVKDFSKIAGSSFVNLLIGLLTTPLITRMVEPEQYGNWSLFVIYSNVLATILLLGTDYIIVRYYYKYKDIAYKRVLSRWCLIISSLAVLVSSVPIVIVLSYERPNWSWFILALLVINIWANVIYRLVNLLLRFENKINILSITTILHKILFVVVAVSVLFYITDKQFIILSFSTTLSVIFIILGCVYFIRYMFCFKGDINIYNLPQKEMLYYGLPLMISGCAYILFQATDKLIIGRYCSEADLGIYSSAASFLSLFTILQGSFTTVWWPSAMKNFENNPNNKSLYIRANDIICFVMVMIGFTFILFKDLVILLLGEDFRAAVVILPFIIFQPILYTLSETTVVGLNFQKKSKAQLLITFSSLLFNVFVNILLTKKLGIIGTSIAVGLSYIFFLTLRSILSYYYYRVDYHFIKMYISVFLLFGFALIHTIFPGELVSYLIVIFLYFIVCAMYKGVISFGYSKIRSIWIHSNN